MERGRLRPLLVSHSAGPGGSNEVILSLLRHRPSEVEPTCVFLGDGPAAGSVRRLGIEVAVVEAGPMRALWRAPLVLSSLIRLIRSTDADVVFAHVPKAHAFASLASLAARVPYLWWQHDPPHVRPRVQAIAARLPARAVVCSSEFSAERFRSLGGRAPVLRVYCGTELGGRLPTHRHERSEGAVVGSVGRLQRYKRHELLLQAARLVLREVPTTRFRIVGGPTPGVDPGYADELAALAGSLGGSAELTGHVDDAPGRMAELDVLVHPAELEPFGLVLVEAMARGVPVVCRPEGGPAEIVRDGVDGLHCDPEDPHALAEAILTLVRDPALRSELARAAAARARSEFSAERMAREAWRIVEAVARREAVVEGIRRGDSSQAGEGTSE